MNKPSNNECPSLSADWADVGEWIVEEIGEIETSPRVCRAIRQMAAICAETAKIFDGLATNPPAVRGTER